MFRTFEYFRPGTDSSAATFSYRGLTRALWGIAVAVVAALIGTAISVYGIFNSIGWLLVGVVIIIGSVVGVVVLIRNAYRYYRRHLVARDDARRGMAGTLDMISNRHIRKLSTPLRTSVHQAQDHATAIADSRAAREGLLGEIDLDADMYEICRLAVEIDGIERGDLRISTILAPHTAGSPLTDRRQRFTELTAAMGDAAAAVQTLDDTVTIDSPAAARAHRPSTVSSAEAIVVRAQAYRELTN